MTADDRPALFRWHDAVTSDPALPLSTRGVAAAMWDRINTLDQPYYETQQNLAARLGVDVKTVRNHQKRLRDRGWITQRRRNNRRAGLADEYALTWPPDYRAPSPANYPCQAGSPGIPVPITGHPRPQSPGIDARPIDPGNRPTTRPSVADPVSDHRASLPANRCRSCGTTTVDADTGLCPWCKEPAADHQ